MTAVNTRVFSTTSAVLTEAAKAAGSLLIGNQSVVKFFWSKVWPERVRDVDLRVGKLPQ